MLEEGRSLTPLQQPRSGKSPADTAGSDGSARRTRPTPRDPPPRRLTSRRGGGREDYTHYGCFFVLPKT